MPYWRLRDTAVGWFWLHWQWQRLAREVAAWGRKRNVELVWIASDREAIVVGNIVASILNLPVHITIYDAFEWGKVSGVPIGYEWLYKREVRQCMRNAVSMDAVTQELLDRLRDEFIVPPPARSMMFPPCLRCEHLDGLPHVTSPSAGEVLRIGFCGAARHTADQWQRFVNQMGRLDRDVELLVCAPKDWFPDAVMPGDVRVREIPYQPTEQDVIRRFRAEGVHACYLGLWRDQARSVFVRTSLSSKLTAYAGVGAPIVVDAPQESAAWRLVDRYGAGILLDGDENSDALKISCLFKDTKKWSRLAAGTAAMCRDFYDLESRVGRFAALLQETSKGR
jgi:hypothetical protein